MFGLKMTPFTMLNKCYKTAFWKKASTGNFSHVVSKTMINSVEKMISN